MVAKMVGLVIHLLLCCTVLAFQPHAFVKYRHAHQRSLATVTLNPPVPASSDRVIPLELNDELKSSFMSYAVSTILGRALPDIRDGLKPVHRRVLYAMQVLNLLPDAGYRKCARIVGEVLGKYHPHGDQSVYDALVRMAQDFVMLHPLVTGHGNFGSVDNDPPAAMRYTEAKLSPLAYESLLMDIKEDAVDFAPNFDGNEEEPKVLPARLPLLLLNGASGIAVGMATNIPPHNLGELCDAMVALIDNPSLPDEDLMKLVPAPDFPTGGELLGQDGARQLYATGHGSVAIRAKCHVEVTGGASSVAAVAVEEEIGAAGTSKSRSKGKSGTAGGGSGRARTAIVVTELPYMTNKAALLEKIADLVNDKKLEGISDLRDETDRDGLRVVIELKRDAIPAVVLNNLYKKTPLQSSFAGNMLAVVRDGAQPKRVTLKEALNEFLAFRFATVRRRSAHRLAKLQARDHLVQGLLAALKRVDAIIHVMKTSKDIAQAREALVSPAFGFSAEQAEAIMSLTLRRLTALEENKLATEHRELTAQITSLEGLMREDSMVYALIKAETAELRAKFAQPRRTVIVPEEKELVEEDLLANERSVVTITKSGYIKRTPVREFEAQGRGGKGRLGARLSTDQDTVAHFFMCNDHDTLLFITDRGVAYSKRAYQIPTASRTARGVPLPQVLPVGSQESVSSVIPVGSFGTSEVVQQGGADGQQAGEDGAQEGQMHLVLLTEQGFVKKTPLKAFKSITNRGLTIISLKNGDRLRWARLCAPQDEVLIATRHGYASRFPAQELPSTGRSSRGSAALTLRDGDRMADIDILKGQPTSAGGDADEAQVLVVTEKGYGKCVAASAFRTQRRGGKGATLMRFKPSSAAGAEVAGKKGKKGEKGKPVAKGDGIKPGREARGVGQADAVSSIRICGANDEIIISTNKGTVTRQTVAAVSVQSRRATGVVLQSIADPEERVVSVDIVPPAQ